MISKTHTYLTPCISFLSSGLKELALEDAARQERAKAEIRYRSYDPETEKLLRERDRFASLHTECLTAMEGRTASSEKRSYSSCGYRQRPVDTRAPQNKALRN